MKEAKLPIQEHETLAMKTSSWLANGCNTFGSGLLKLTRIFKFPMHLQTFDPRCLDEEQIIMSYTVASRIEAGAHDFFL